MLASEIPDGIWPSPQITRFSLKADIPESTQLPPITSEAALRPNPGRAEARISMPKADLPAEAFLSD